MFLEGNNQESEHDRIESLRVILEREQRRSVTHDEAFEIAHSLISFYEALAEDPIPNESAALEPAQ